MIYMGLFEIIMRYIFHKNTSAMNAHPSMDIFPTSDLPRSIKPQTLYRYPTITFANEFY